MTRFFDINIYLNSLLRKKPENLILLDLRKVEAVTDFFIICHGKYSRQVVALAEHVKSDLKNTKNIWPFSFEGLKEGKWVILDYGFVIIHIFQEPFRSFYNLEEFWSNAISFEIKDINSFDENFSNDKFVSC